VLWVSTCQAQHSALSVAELKRVIEALPLEKNAVAIVAPRLVAFSPPDFCALLRELARDNHAFRWLSVCLSAECLLWELARDNHAFRWLSSQRAYSLRFRRPGFAAPQCAAERAGARAAALLSVCLSVCRVPAAEFHLAVLPFECGKLGGAA
jgi:hypothetical protein